MRKLSALLLLIAVTTIARADDWPQWMGPKRDNVWREKGILDSFPKGGPKVLWRAEVAHGYSGPAIADGLVFLTDFVVDADVGTKDNFTRTKYVGSERVLCLDAKTGKLKWKHEYPCTYDVSYPNGPRCTPNYEAGKLYTLGAQGDLFCFDAKSGKVNWSLDLKKQYDVKAPLWGFAAHPLIDGNRLICLVGAKSGLVVAFDKTNGKEIWKSIDTGESGPGYSPPSIVEAAGKRQLIIWEPATLNGLNPETGEVYWSIKQQTVNGTSIMSPRTLGNDLFIGAWQNKGGLYKLNEKKPGIALAWKGKNDTSVYPINNTPYLEDGHIYGVCTEGELRCVNIKDGERLWGTFEPVAGKKLGSGTAHLVKHEDRFFITAETGDLIIAKLSPKGYTEISRWHMQDPTCKAFGRDVYWSHPAFANQCIFARNDRELICVSLAK
ncbi:MAG TPA: PQQ-binding-like beta-propeller repeat protein [Gemmataceae bacterium]|nr:PQQ-binding-like beta-propeller repeat protein [Gemmataceae bacterium]